MESKRLTIQMNPVGLYTFQNPQLQLPLQELLEDHYFQGHCGTKNGDHFGVRIVLGSIWGSFQGWDHYFSGRDHFRSCAAAR